MVLNNFLFDLDNLHFFVLTLNMVVFLELVLNQDQDQFHHQFVLLKHLYLKIANLQILYYYFYLVKNNLMHFYLNYLLARLVYYMVCMISKFHHLHHLLHLINPLKNLKYLSQHIFLLEYILVTHQ